MHAFQNQLSILALSNTKATYKIFLHKANIHFTYHYIIQYLYKKLDFWMFSHKHRQNATIKMTKFSIDTKN